MEEARPWLPISACVFGITAMSRNVWSSVVNMITLGLLLAARDFSPRASSASMARQAIPASKNPTLRARGPRINRT